MFMIESPTPSTILKLWMRVTAKCVPVLFRLFVLAWCVLSVCACAPVPQAVSKARSLVFAHRQDEARSLLAVHLEAHPEDVEAHALLIRLYGERSDIQSARAQVERLRAVLPPNDPRPDIELGKAHELMHNFDDALVAYDRASMLAPLSPLGPKTGGLRAAHWGEAAEAKPRLEEALRRGDRDPNTFHALGLCYVHLGQNEQALAAYEQGAALEQGTSNLLGIATVALSVKDYAAALAAYDRLLVRSPRHVAAALGRAYCLARLGRTEEATQALASAQALGAPPSNVAKIRALLPDAR
jgi:tetratricopeptide (TPR) repeat protein